jgi:hypothetical protein
VKDKRRGGGVSYLVALIAVIFGVEWGFDYILDAHRRARARNGPQKIAPKKA